MPTAEIKEVSIYLKKKEPHVSFSERDKRNSLRGDAGS